MMLILCGILCLIGTTAAFFGFRTVNEEEEEGKGPGCSCLIWGLTLIGVGLVIFLFGSIGYSRMLLRYWDISAGWRSTLASIGFTVAQIVIGLLVIKLAGWLFPIKMSADNSETWPVHSDWRTHGGP